MHIRSWVTRKPVKEKRHALCPIVPIKKRDFSYEYSFKDCQGVTQKVCRQFFLDCVQITPSRVHTAMNTSVSNPNAVDRRGRLPSKNKTSENATNEVINFIKLFPKYESHYGRSSSQKQYLHHNLNIKKLYDEYKKACELKNPKINPVSSYIFREIFNTKFNLSFKRRHTDTCKTCDEYNCALKSFIIPTGRKSVIKSDKNRHLQMIADVRDEFVHDIENALASEGTMSVLTFDLQKTLDTPSLTTSVAYYKRQLWTYNLCIFNEIEKKGFMYVWPENIASRGGQEIGSCLIKHINNHLPDTTKKLILYSDRCGGQNRNIKLTLLLKFVLASSPTMESIEQKYLVSGHSYNACDRCFGLIEKERKKHEVIPTPNAWIQIISDSKKSEPKFTVIAMQTEDFFSSFPLHQLIVNRKHDTDKKKVNWLKIRSMCYKKQSPFIIEMRNEENEIQKVNLKKKNIEPESFQTCELPFLFPNGHAITKQKFKDLMDLKKFLLAEHHQFYNDLKFNEQTELDYGLASDVSDEE